MKKKSTREPIENEADNGLKNDFGTIAMARTGDPHSATAQFFINVSDNDFLNHSGKNSQGWGYAVFGKVASGTGVAFTRNPSTGERVLWRTIAPVQAAVSGLRTVIAAPDGALVYSYSRARTQLYVIRGLK